MIIHIISIAILIFTLFLAISPILLSDKGNRRRGVVLAIAVVFVIFSYNGIAGLAAMRRAPLFTGSEAEGWLILFFVVIPFIWLYINTPRMLFGIVFIGLSIFAGMMLQSMQFKANRTEGISALQKFCNFCYGKLSFLYLCASGIVPLLWLIFFWW